MSDLEWLDIKGAAQYLRRSDRSIRRYLQQGRLEHRKEELRAGGFRYLISRSSLDSLRGGLDSVQGLRAGTSGAGIADLTALVQGLQETIDSQAEQITRLEGKVDILTEQLSRFLPPAREEALAKVQAPASWWRRLWRAGPAAGRPASKE
jgi:hypothetical protein